MARLPYLSREDLPPEQRPTYERIAQSRGRMARTFSVLLSSPEAASQVADLGEYLRFQSSLDPTIRETATLTTAREANNQYIWSHHEPRARQAGVREKVIQAIRDRQSPQRLLPKEGVLIRYAQEMLRNGRVNDATYQAVLHLLGPQGVTDLTVIIGYYHMLAHINTALEVELEPEWPPLLPE
ncbi:MAG: carboxymuconolactone decarboxylase family protein [Dehalococcoidia bacterium]